MRILIADDDFTSRRLLQKSLEAHGECDAAGNGKEAWEAFLLAKQDGQPYRMILLDIMMPEMDGREVLKRIRDHEKGEGISGESRVLIAMATSKTDKASVIGSFQDECDGYIRKPYSRDSLLSDLRKYSLLPPG